MTTAEIQALNEAHVINTYGARNIAMVRGDGMRLWDADGREYLDFFAGIAVVNLGHCPATVTEAIAEQARTLVHVSNLYYIEPQVKLAALLCEHTFADQWFFCNSGAESVEAAIKLTRRYWAKKGTPKPIILSANQSFHGRTIGAVTVTGQPKYHEGFEPMLPDVGKFDYGDMKSLEAAVTDKVGGILLEPIQGEGGVVIPPSGYLEAVRKLCDHRGILLIFDEVQTGLGRTGSLFAHTQHGIAPDIMTVAKGLGNGIPIGALGCTAGAATGFSVGSHASTFGGNPLSSAAALATLTALTKPGFIETAAEVGEYFAAGLRALGEEFDTIADVRSKGLMIGMEMRKPAGPLVNAMIESGVICGPAGPNVLRFLPPLIVSKEDVDTVLPKLETALEIF